MTRLRVAEVAPPIERIPPLGYGGTERVVFELVQALDRRGHEVTTFASGDSEVPGRLVATAPFATRPSGRDEDPMPWIAVTMRFVIEHARRGEFDVIHSHLDAMGIVLAAASPVPVVTTYHNRIDGPGQAAALVNSPAHHVAVSAHQAGTRPEVVWDAVIHNGLTLSDMPFHDDRTDGLVFVGRIAPEKGAVEAIEIAKATGRPLVIAAIVGTTPHEREYHESVFLPALRAAGDLVEFVGELDGRVRDELVARSYASLMPCAWPEPFGLVAIESLACGTPVLARRVGALPELIREGEDGFFGDDVTHFGNLVERVAGLDRAAIRARALTQFSAERMTDEYEALMRQVQPDPERGSADPTTMTDR